MAKDLEHIKRNDKKLREVVEKKRMQHGREEEIAAKSNEVTEKNEHVEEGEALPEMMSDQLRNEILRKQWEKDEERLKDKKDVHYQDVLFGGLESRINNNEISDWNTVECLSAVKTLATVYLEKNPVAEDPMYRRKLKLIAPSLTQIDATLCR
ncbi:unnamed protein product [Acanthoscelides obtectus]|uniref:Uncharacterized protein n=1 Tax=Acanthoscelides obtectus TaxID=200917 RepID=A0A9P0QFV0_ACAOB|nr:unnamed protein product [Acanthoscelides obtectus]CAK1682815.1 Protein phosphatase 1 regulatory subunit 7 [Acanthoscelides obtectus]